MNDASWLLPEGVEEILPDAALKLERLRRNILDDLLARQFKLVTPPVMEFVDSLLTGTGEELDTQTYKFMDQHTHRMLGIRADMTPQIARIDAHYFAVGDNTNSINRLCYAGTVLRTQPDQMGGQRELLQIGAEVFGEASTSADIEVIEAMLAALKLSNAEDVTLSLGHVGLYRALLRIAELSSASEPRLFDILLRKSSPDLIALGAYADVSLFQTLIDLQGDTSVLAAAKQLLPHDNEIDDSLAQIKTVVDHLRHHHPKLKLHIDLADVMGYRYHTGLKFFAYVDDCGRAIAKGGRYDRIGERFGRARAATGFSADLKSLIKLS